MRHRCLGVVDRAAAPDQHNDSTARWWLPGRRHQGDQSRIGNATIHIEGQDADYSSEDNGNFRIVLPVHPSDRVAYPSVEPGIWRPPSRSIPPSVI